LGTGIRLQLVATLILVVAVGACSNTPPPTVKIPESVPSPSGPDGIYITGAVNAVYPLANFGTCLLSPLDGRMQLMFSAEALHASEATVGWVLADYGGLGAYSTVSEYVRANGRGWTGSHGDIQVNFADNELIRGTVNWPGVTGTNDKTEVGVSGWWKCHVLLSPIPTPIPSPLVFPSPTPLPVGTPVTRQVLAPAKVLPLAALCSYKVYVTADGNYNPTFCRGGAINVVAWRAYAPLGVNVMSLGRGATRQVIQSAMCRDMAKTDHATLPEEQYAYELSAAYYGWTFLPEPSCR
jgi:hypothetical protein